MTRFETWVYAHEVASRYKKAEVMHAADGRYVIWIITDGGEGYWYDAHSD